MNYCKVDGHDYTFTEYTDGHQFLACTLCGKVMLDTRNRLTYEEKRDLLKAVLFAPLLIGAVWAYIVLMWVAFG